MNRSDRFAQNFSDILEIPLDLRAEHLRERLGAELTAQVAGTGLRTLDQVIDDLGLEVKVDRLRGLQDRLA